MFSSSVDSDPWRCLLLLLAGDVDHMPRTSLLHPRQELSQHVEVAPDVDIDHLVPCLIVGLHNQPEGNDPSCVDEDVGDAEGSDDFRTKILNLEILEDYVLDLCRSGSQRYLISIRSITWIHRSSPTFLEYLLLDLLQLVPPSRHQDTVDTFT